MSMQLYHRELLLCEITAARPEGVWISAEIHLAVAAEAYMPFFAYMTDESHDLEEPPFDEELLRYENWFIEDETGTKRGISVPAVHRDNGIDWRWR